VPGAPVVSPAPREEFWESGWLKMKPGSWCPLTRNPATSFSPQNPDQFAREPSPQKLAALLADPEEMPTFSAPLVVKEFEEHFSWTAIIAR